MNKNDRLPLDRLIRKMQQDKDSELKPLPVASERFTDEEFNRIKLDVAKRVLDAFSTDNMAEIARRCQTTNSTIKTYIDGDRLPIAEILIKMHRATGVSLDWLILGKGRKFVIDRTDENFTEEEMRLVEELAALQERTPQQMIRALALAQLAALERLKE